MRPILDVHMKMAGVVGCLQRRGVHVSVRERELVSVCDCMYGGWNYVETRGVMCL